MVVVELVVVVLVVVTVLALVVDLAMVMVLVVVMVLAFVVVLAMVVVKGKVIIEECLDTLIDHFRMLLTNYNVSYVLVFHMFLFFICSCCNVQVISFVLIVITNYYVSLIVGMVASQPNKPTIKE